MKCLWFFACNVFPFLLWH